MIVWLAALALFPILAALYLGGAAILLPLLARLTFRVVGVRITSAEGASGENAA